MICELKSNPRWGEKLHAVALEAHQQRVAANSEYGRQAQEDLKTRPEHVSIKRYALFQILHKTFSGSGVLGLAWTLGTSKKIARWVLRK